MDKYEFSIKAEQIEKLVNKSDYETAVKIADTIDWRKVRNAHLLSMVAQVYEKNSQYQKAKDILLLAFERAPIGKRLLFKLTVLALKEDNVQEAQAYYREFCDLAGDDPRQHLLRYMILKHKNAPVEQMINSLESYTSEELDEKWLCELAELYHTADDAARCVSTCDKIMLMFGLGKYVDKAMELKLQYAPLTKYQMDLVENREKYEERLRAVEQSFNDGTGLEADYEETAEPTVEPESTCAEGGSYGKEAIAADADQVEAEEDLAKEMTRPTTEEGQRDDGEPGKTEVIADTKCLQEKKEESTLSQEEPAFDVKSETASYLMIEARTPEKGLEIAIQTLKRIQKETGIKNPVAKISGSRLNKRGVLASADKLKGKDLMVEEAGDLSLKMLEEMESWMEQDIGSMRIILIDNPKQMEDLCARNPFLASKFEQIGEGRPESDDRPVRHVTPERHAAAKQSVSVAIPVHEHQEHEKDSVADEEMDIDEFAQYACKYALEIDCSITGKSMLALYERIEIIEEDGIPLTRKTAEELIEEAADKAEKPSIGKKIKGLFSSKYNKDGLLILKEEHFI